MLCVQLVQYGQPGPSAVGVDVFTSWGPASAMYVRDQPGGCTSDQYILQSSTEAGILNLTLEQGAQIAFAILAVWAIGAVHASLIRVLRNDGSTSVDERD